MATDILNRVKKQIAVLRGGPSPEYDFSLASGSNILRNMPEKYSAHDVFISKDGKWHIGGVAKSPEKILKQFDAVVNALHGRFGEDGGVQTILETFGMPYTGSTRLSSALSLNKHLSKNTLSKIGIAVPRHALVRSADLGPNTLAEIFRSFPGSSVVKPVLGGSSISVALARDFPLFERAVNDALAYDDMAMVEEYIPGQEVTCSVIEGSSGLFALTPVEVVHDPAHGFFSYEAKCGAGNASFSCPASISNADRERIQELALSIHKALGLRHYSNSDFVIHPQKGIYYLETNALPGMGERSLLPKALAQSGISLSDFIDHVLVLAQK